MLRITTVILILLMPLLASAQYTYDNPNQKINSQKSDTDRALEIFDLSTYYINRNIDSALLLAQKAYFLSGKK